MSTPEEQESNEGQPPEIDQLTRMLVSDHEMTDQQPPAGSPLFSEPIEHVEEEQSCIDLAENLESALIMMACSLNGEPEFEAGWKSLAGTAQITTRLANEYCTMLSSISQILLGTVEITNLALRQRGFPLKNALCDQIAALVVITDDAKARMKGRSGVLTWVVNLWAIQTFRAPASFRQRIENEGEISIEDVGKKLAELKYLYECLTERFNETGDLLRKAPDTGTGSIAQATRETICFAACIKCGRIVSFNNQLHDKRRDNGA
jgi:hypothetical protein